MDTETHFGNWKVVFSPLAALFSCSYKRSNFTTGTLYNGDIVHWTLEVDETFLKVVQKKLNTPCLMKPRRSICSCFKEPTKTCSSFRIRCSNVGSFSFGIFWRGISWEEGEIVLQGWVLHTVSECEILHETSNGEFQIQNIDTYMKPASISFTTLWWPQHKFWLRNSI